MKLLPYSGSVTLCGSKSILQRYLFIASLVQGKMVLQPGSVCADVREMLEAVVRSGAEAEISAAAITIDSGKVKFLRNCEVYFSASATALRFWLARSLFTGHKTTINLSKDLVKRPLEPFLENLRRWGCEVTVSPVRRKQFPYRIVIIPPQSVPEKITVDADISSQFISGLMMAGRMVQEGFAADFRHKPVSFYYLQLTKYVLDNLRVNIHLEDRFFLVQGGNRFTIPETIHIEPELSGGAFFLALGAFSGKGIGIHTTPNPRLQPDWQIVGILQSMGAVVTSNNELVSILAKELHGVSLDMEHYPDLIPLVAILALFADSPTVLKGISRLKYKESDRLKGILEAFRKIGAGFLYAKGILQIYPLEKDPGSVTLDTQKDHRLVIAFTLLKQLYPQVTLSETASVQKSCPEFFALLDSLKSRLSHQIS